MFRLETTWTTDKDNFIKVRGLTRPRFFCGNIFRRRARASSPVRYAVRHLILSPLCASVHLCLCVNFITETQRLRDTESYSLMPSGIFYPSAPLLLCLSALKLFYRRVEIHLLILSILLILSKNSVSQCLCASVLKEDSKSPNLPNSKSPSNESNTNTSRTKAD